MIQARHFVISGRVQGVCYRASALEQARRLGLAGWVRNRSDGRVEALAEGSPEALEAFEHWLHQGPSMANVTEVLSSDRNPEHLPSFEIR